MTRPRVICHMHTLLNGKVDGLANITDVGMRAQRAYFDLILGEHRFYAKSPGWINGRGTGEAILGGPRDLVLPTTFDPVPDGDFIAHPDAEHSLFIADGSGKLAWDRGTFSYFDLKAPIVSLICGSVSDAYKAFLRTQGVSYIIAGADRLDMGVAVRKIGDLYNTDEVILGGGPHLNWSMIRDGLVDELSLLLMPTADAQADTFTLFESDPRYATPAPVDFELISAKPLDDGSVWLRYNVIGAVEERPAT